MNGPGGTGRNGRGMKKQVTTIGFAVLIAVATVTAAWAQVSRHDRTHGYATDHFEGFDALDEDSRIPQKKNRSGIRWTPKHQPPRCRSRRKKRAGTQPFRAQSYEALIREWPTAPEAAQANTLAAFWNAREVRKAFDEYQYLITHYAGHCPYQKCSTASSASPITCCITIPVCSGGL